MFNQRKQIHSTWMRSNWATKNFLIFKHFTFKSTATVLNLSLFKIPWWHFVKFRDLQAFYAEIVIWRTHLRAWPLFYYRRPNGRAILIKLWHINDFELLQSNWVCPWRESLKKKWKCFKNYEPSPYKVVYECIV